jgi:diacylglycerol kinase family enzyme
MAGIGLDGAVVEGVRLAEKKAIGKGAYLLSALRRLADWDRQWLALAVAAGRLPAGNDFTSFYARNLEVSGSKAVQVDGDYCCHAPLSITAVENFVRVIV